MVLIQVVPRNVANNVPNPFAATSKPAQKKKASSKKKAATKKGKKAKKAKGKR